jgi:tRNA(Ile)-lysidine synthase
VNDLEQRVEQSILGRHLLRRGERILVAVSGGLDSMVLLNVLAWLSSKHRWRLCVAHFNHQLRGRRSDADERLVARTASQLGFKFVRGSADVRNHAQERKLSLEMAARELRHDFLARTAGRLKISSIALAHHADDQVELFFLRLLRGAGGEGLAGMKWRSPSPAKRHIWLVRPLLGSSKVELDAFAIQEEIPFREDATNLQLDIQRNRVRRELVPLLAGKYQPALSRVILRQMEILGAEAEAVTQLAVGWLKSSKESPAWGEADMPFAKLPVAVQRRCLQIQAVEAGLTLDFGCIEALRGTPERPFAIDPSVVVDRDKAGRLHVRSAKKPGFNEHRRRVHLRGGGGTLTFDSVRITWNWEAVENGTFRAQKEADCEFLDFDKVGGIVILRHWQPGDRFQPLGMSAAVKLQDLFTNQKVLRELRHGMIVGATAGGEIFWVEGLRLGERFKLDNRTRRWLKWSWKRL